MKKLFFAGLVLVMNLSANASNLKEGKSTDFNSMKKESVQLTPEQFIEKIKVGDMSWSRGGITYEEYLQTIADWCNETNVWQLAGFKKPLNAANVKYMIVNSSPMLLTVPAKAMKIMGSNPTTGTVGYFFNEFEMDVKFLTFKSNNGYLIPLVKYTCFNGGGGYAVSPDVITVTKVNEVTKINYRDSVVQVIERVRIEDHVTVIDRVTQVNQVYTGCSTCQSYQPVYCQGYDRPVATGFGLSLGLNFTFVKNNQQAAPAQPININISNPVTVINTNTNNNNNNNNQQNTPVVLPGEVIVPQTPGGQPVDGNPVVINPGGTPVDPNPVVINPGGTPVDPNGTILNPNGTPVDPNGTATNPDGTPVDPLKNSSANTSARIASVSPVQVGSGKFGSKDQTTAKVNTEQPITTVAPQQKSGKFGQVTPQSNSGSKIAATPVQQTVVKNGKFGQTSQNAYVAPTNNQSARNVQPTYTNGSSAKYKNQSSYSPQPVYTNKPANVNYGNNGSSRFSNNSSSMNNSGARMNTGPRPGSGKFK